MSIAPAILATLEAVAPAPAVEKALVLQVCVVEEEFEQYVEFERMVNSAFRVPEYRIVLLNEFAPGQAE